MHYQIWEKQTPNELKQDVQMSKQQKLRRSLQMYQKLTPLF